MFSNGEVILFFTKNDIYTNGKIMLLHTKQKRARQKIKENGKKKQLYIRL